MSAIPMRGRFWAVYAAAWTPFAAIYTVIFLVVGGATLPRAFAWATCYVGSAALLGLLVLRLCERFPWSWHRRDRFFAVHAAAAPLYAVLWISIVLLVMTIEQSIVAGRWSPIVPSPVVVLWTLLIGILIYGTTASVAYVVQVTNRLREQEALRARAELVALRAQLNPHFLFNTLHSLMALVRHDPQAAEDALERFGELLRYVLKSGDEHRQETDDVPLSEEWAFVENYLALEKLRLADRLRIETRIAPESLECAVPAFTLQPLVENAIKHAVAPRVGGGRVTIASRVDGDDLVVEVEDDGPGADPSALEDSAGLGLRAVRRRLELRYPGRVCFSFETAPDEGVSIRIRVPAEPSDGPPEDRR